MNKYEYLLRLLNKKEQLDWKLSNYPNGDKDSIENAIYSINEELKGFNSFEVNTVQELVYPMISRDKLKDRLEEWQKHCEQKRKVMIRIKKHRMESEQELEDKKQMEKKEEEEALLFSFILAFITKNPSVLYGTTSNSVLAQFIMQVVSGELESSRVSKPKLF